MGGKSDAPAAPDYYALAQQQSQEQGQLLQQQTQANRPNTSTPFGSTAWTYNPGTAATNFMPSWTGSQTLTPEMQSLLNQQEGAAGTTLANKQAAGTAAGNLFNTDMSTGQFNPVDYSGAPKVSSGNYYNQQAQDAVWNQFQNMEQPLMDQQKEQQQSSLEAQGLRPGDTAYDNAMKNLSNTQFQQTQSAQDQAVLAGEQEAQTMQGMDINANQNYIGNMNMQQNQNMNLFNSLMGGGAVGSPSGSTGFSGANAGAASAPNLTGAGENMYQAALNSTNASNAGNASLWSGLISAAGMAAMALA